MFQSLRNRLILINLGITSLVIVIVFTFIYVFATNSAEKRPLMEEQSFELFSEDIERAVRLSLENEKQAAARNLLWSLIASGLAIEIVVALVSYFLAEEAIKPVREAYDAQKIFIANASHEIKTPLAAISANLEAADIHDNKWIGNIEKETVKLTTLNNELLSLARTDLVEQSRAEEVDLAKLINETISELTPRLKNRTFQKKILLPPKVTINREDFLQILNILLDNAIKYSDEKIMLSCEEGKLTVQNDGVTISEKDLSHVFERFYQADKTAEGVGLGLSIAKAKAERNDWDLSAESGKKYTKFILKF